MINLFIARRKLANLWFVFACLLFIIFFALTMYSNRFENKTKEVWGWFLPHFVPTLSLIAGVSIADLVDSRRTTSVIPKFFFRLTFWTSFLYLTILTLVIMSTVPKADDIQAHYEAQSIYLIPLQTLTATFIGIFFSKAGHAKDDSHDSKATNDQQKEK